ncbi:AsnC family protein [Embleya scabrispora]|uniref:AsnC family protein n=1 Tax=Embleya scabrispora TaxID=159449 RepID=A0A1T3NSF0_9ACTN|nr:AsnC family transcriptional regulator [Embleya scabrispora]OPC79602.1 AsnC family protein [Embleya scabrispora]
MDSTRLDRLERQLVHALQIDGRAPLSRVAAVLDVSDQTVARRYRKLHNSGAMRVLGLPDVSRFGQVEWLVRIQCSPDAAAGVAAALARRDDTSWVSLTAGGTEIVCVTRSGPRTDGDSLLLQKLPRTPRVVGVTAHNILHAFSGGPTGWHGKADSLTPDQIRELDAGLGDPPTRRERLEMFEGDGKLLAMLALDGRAGYAKLAEVTGWSESTAKRRLERLRRARALFFDVEIDSALLGYEAEMMLWLSVPPAALVAVGEALAEHHEVAFAAAVTGSANLVAMVACHDTDDFYHYLTTRIATLTQVVAMETAPVIRSVKRAGSVPKSLSAGSGPPRR